MVYAQPAGRKRSSVSPARARLGSCAPARPQPGAPALQEASPRMLLERLRAPVVAFERLQRPVARHVHDLEQIGAVLERSWSRSPRAANGRKKQSDRSRRASAARLMIRATARSVRGVSAHGAAFANGCGKPGLANLR